jgi:hypothetical protein
MIRKGDPMKRIQLDEPIKPHGLIRFLIVLIPCLLLRFYLGQIEGSFYWFAALYLPTINYGIYWMIGSVRILLNKTRGTESISISKLRLYYKWYLNLPGALGLAELVYQGYLFNR